MQPTGPEYPTDFSMKQEISKAVLPILAVCQLHFSVSCRMSCRLFHEAGTPKNGLAFRQVQQSFLCGSCVSSSYIIASSSPEKSNFLPKWLTNAIRNLFNVHYALDVDWCCQEQMCLTAMKIPKFLKMLNAIFHRSLKGLKII